jgi:hypothetical protein
VTDEPDGGETPERSDEDDGQVEAPGAWREGDIVDIEAPEAPAGSEAEPSPAESAEPSEQGRGEQLEPPPPAVQEPELIRVAVGLSTELDGNREERALLDRLQASTEASPRPRAEVRRLRVGSSPAREVCREGRDDLVITIGYLPDRVDPVLLSHDCRIDEDLGVRAAEAAEDPDLLGVLWAEHERRVQDGARERRRLRISPKVRTGLIAGAAVAVIGVAVGLLIAGAVRRDTVVIRVSPNAP